jgi:hypothetical protein
MALSDYVADVESGKRDNSSVPISAALDSFLNAGRGVSSVLLVEGDPGAGKTLFVQRSVADFASTAREALSSIQWTLPRFLHEALRREKPSPVRIPVVLRLLKFGPSDLPGVVAAHLKETAHVTEGELAALQGGPSPLQVVVFCDGFDELRSSGTSGSIRHFVETILGGAWTEGSIKVVVTSRDLRHGQSHEGDLFPNRVKRVVLPFTAAQASVVL